MIKSIIILLLLWFVYSHLNGQKFCYEMNLYECDQTTLVKEQEIRDITGFIGIKGIDKNEVYTLFYTLLEKGFILIKIFPSAKIVKVKIDSLDQYEFDSLFENIAHFFNPTFYTFTNSLKTG